MLAFDDGNEFVAEFYEHQGRVWDQEDDSMAALEQMGDDHQLQQQCSSFSRGLW